MKNLQYNQNQKGKSKLWTVVCGTVMIFIAAQLIVSNILAVKGQEISNNETKAVKLARENHLLQQGLSRNTALNYIEKMAEEKGFVKPAVVTYFDLTSSVAVLPQ